jgi:hypothetical protein
MRSGKTQLRAVAARHRVTLLVVLAAVLASSGTAVAVSFVLGTTNTASTTTTLKSPVNGAALQLTNTNSTGGTSARGLGINVPAGRPPMTVNSSVKVTNLNADKLDGNDSSAFLAAGGKATDADKLDGLDSNAFLPAGGTAANADYLDGFDSADFIQGQGAVVHGARALAPNTGGWLTVLLTSNPQLRVAYNCPATLTNAGILVFINESNELVNAFWDNGSENPEYLQLAANGGRHDLFAAAVGEHYTWQVQGSQITTFEIFSVHRATDCHVEVEAVISR